MDKIKKKSSNISETNEFIYKIFKKLKIDAKITQSVIQFKFFKFRILYDMSHEFLEKEICLYNRKNIEMDNNIVTLQPFLKNYEIDMFNNVTFIFNSKIDFVVRIHFGNNPIYFINTIRYDEYNNIHDVIDAYKLFIKNIDTLISSLRIPPYEITNEYIMVIYDSIKYYFYITNLNNIRVSIYDKDIKNEECTFQNYNVLYPTLFTTKETENNGDGDIVYKTYKNTKSARS